ncbi:MAG: hypothetical protein NTY53_22020 [Kiritimatiellaeota bacterium]|nr:hypothetical protein [Kiritimatiellota bacterium]
MNFNGSDRVSKDVVEAWVRNSQLVSRWQAIKHEIELHKWYESEKAGHDIGWDRAAVSWQMHYGHLRDEEPHR